MNRMLRWSTAACALGLMFSPLASAGVVFGENWELGLGKWKISNGVWDVGEPTAGPGGAQEGQWCAGTNLNGGYPASADTRLESPLIQLPMVGADEKLELRFWQWFSFTRNGYGSDAGFVEVYRTSTGAWQRVSGDFGPYNWTWSLCALDLTALQGEQIRLGFRFYSNYRDSDQGWFIDDLEVRSFVPQFPNPETYESGWGDNSASNGVWQVGIPTYGPPSTPSGQACASTRLGGNFPPSTSSRLVGPCFDLVAVDGESPELHVDHWFQLVSNGYGTDWASIQIRDLTGGADWATLQSFTGSSSGPDGWQHQSYDLSAYAGKTVRIGFLFSSNYRDEAAGWSVDNVQVSGIVGHLHVELEEFGTGLGGSGDFVPHLYGSEGLATGGFVVRCDQMLGGAFVILWAGLGKIDVPFKGGRFYIDLSQPFEAAAFRAFGAKGVPGAGYFNFLGPDLTEFEGLPITVQVTVVDDGAPRGVALSNGLDVLTVRR